MDLLPPWRGGDGSRLLPLCTLPHSLAGSLCIEPSSAPAALHNNSDSRLPLAVIGSEWESHPLHGFNSLFILNEKRGARPLFRSMVETAVVELLRPLQFLASGYNPCKSSLFLVRMRHVEWHPKAFESSFRIIFETLPTLCEPPSKNGGNHLPLFSSVFTIKKWPSPTLSLVWRPFSKAK